MSTPGARGGVWGRARRRWRWAAALALAGAALLVRVPCDVSTRARFPHVAPARLADLLADFAHQPHVSGSGWRMESDRSDHTSWRYAVRYECGARCAGRARVEAHHERAHEHRVRVHREHCGSLLLLPWPQFCDSVETECTVLADGASGSVVSEVARAHCAPLGALLGSCASTLRQQRDAYFAQLRAVLGA